MKIYLDKIARAYCILRQSSRPILAASLVFAMALTLSCYPLVPAGQGLEKYIPKPKSKIINLAPCKDGTVKIGSQVWQKCDLNVKPSTGESNCYEEDNDNCTKYGRLYDRAAAMALPSLCPSGWHIPGIAEWNKLLATVSEDARSLQIKGWGGSDSYGFSARPDPYGNSGCWWSATASYNGYHCLMINNIGGSEFTDCSDIKIRCIKD
ncbi:hypothetical protein R83H12_02652 [Fibrobacteria bacterium R8-3-H12]